MKKILVVAGPTAVGKSSLAVRLAKKFKGEVVSADSRQVYAGLDIGTGKITEKEMKGIPHHLLDVIDPKKQFTVSDFARLGDAAIEEIIKNKKIPVICGGTGFYIQALVDNIILPEVPPNFPLRNKLEKKTPAELFTILKKLDPQRAKNIDGQNPRRLIRAIEIATALGKVPSFTKNKSEYKPIFIGLSLPSEKLRKNIKTRLEKRIKEGMIKEAQKLHKNDLSWKRMDSLGLEYRYLALYLQKKMTLEEMKNKLETEIWHYAQRQYTWFKRDKRIIWLDPKNKAGIARIEGKISRFLDR